MMRNRSDPLAPGGGEGWGEGVNSLIALTLTPNLSPRWRGELNVYNEAGIANMRKLHVALVDGYKESG